MEKSRDVWTINSLLNWTINYFKSKGIESARLDKGSASVSCFGTEANLFVCAF